MLWSGFGQTNLKKIYWPAISAAKGMRSQEAITKGDMLRYYYNVAEYIMPYMKDRPQSLNRFPDGINGESFYHKNMGGKVDKWLKTFRRISDSSNEPYLQLVLPVVWIARNYILHPKEYRYEYQWNPMF